MDISKLKRLEGKSRLPASKESSEKFLEIVKSDIKPEKKDLTVLTKDFDVTCSGLDEATEKIKLLKREMDVKKAGIYYKQGLILNQITTYRWYKHKYKFFKEYVETEFGFSVAYAYILIKIVQTFSYDQIIEIADKFKVIEKLATIRTSDENRIKLLDQSKKMISDGKSNKEIKQTIEKSLKREKEPEEVQTVAVSTDDVVDHNLLIEQKVKKIPLMTENGERVRTVSELLDKRQVGMIIQMTGKTGCQVVLDIDNDGIITVVREFVEIEEG